MKLIEAAVDEKLDLKAVDLIWFQKFFIQPFHFVFVSTFFSFLTISLLALK